LRAVSARDRTVSAQIDPAIPRFDEAVEALEARRPGAGRKLRIVAAVNHMGVQLAQKAPSAEEYRLWIQLVSGLTKDLLDEFGLTVGDFQLASRMLRQDLRQDPTGGKGESDGKVEPGLG